MLDNRGQLMFGLQQKIDDLQHQLNDLTEQGAKHLSSNEEQRLAIEERMGKLITELEQQRLAHAAAVNDSSV